MKKSTHERERLMMIWSIILGLMLFWQTPQYPMGMAGMSAGMSGGCSHNKLLKDGRSYSKHHAGHHKKHMMRH